jgi:hypothetical protein
MARSPRSSAATVRATRSPRPVRRSLSHSRTSSRICGGSSAAASCSARCATLWITRSTSNSRACASTADTPGGSAPGAASDASITSAVLLSLISRRCRRRDLRGRGAGASNSSAAAAMTVRTRARNARELRPNRPRSIGPYTPTFNSKLISTASHTITAIQPRSRPVIAPPLRNPNR